MQFESRATVGLLPPNSRPRIPGPVESLTVHYNGPSVPIRASDPHSVCRAFWRGVQAFHMGPQRGWADVAYTMANCIHGILMAGRGAGVRTAANGTSTGNDLSYALFCMIGEGQNPSTAMLNSIGIARVGLGVPRLRHHSYWKATACAGAALNRWVRDNPFAGHDVPPPKEEEKKPDPIIPQEDVMLVRIDGQNTVYHVVGTLLFPLHKAEQAKLHANAEVWGPSVRNITSKDVAEWELTTVHRDVAPVVQRLVQLTGPTVPTAQTSVQGSVMSGLNAFLHLNQQGAKLPITHRIDR